MTSNDNLPPAVLRAVEWAETIPASVAITQHADFAKYFGGLDQAGLLAASDELERRAAVAAAEAKELRGFVGGRRDNRTAATVAARETLKSIGYDPNWTKEQLVAACENLDPDKIAEVRDALRVGAAAFFQEADLLERLGELGEGEIVGAAQC